MLKNSLRLAQQERRKDDRQFSYLLLNLVVHFNSSDYVLKNGSLTEPCAPLLVGKMGQMRMLVIKMGKTTGQYQMQLGFGVYPPIT